VKLAVDVPNSKLLLWTYKEGLLSRVAHDLQFAATAWEGTLERDGERVLVSVTVPVSGLRLEGKVKGGAVTPMKPKDQREIESNLRGSKVLDAARAATITYRGEGSVSGGLVQLQGELTLKGQTRPLALVARVREEGDVLAADGEVSFRQSDFGVRPFSAMLGALKVQDSIRISWSLRCPAL
jgi:polyisoprenoid-binding protein YceI